MQIAAGIPASRSTCCSTALPSNTAARELLREGASLRPTTLVLREARFYFKPRSTQWLQSKHSQKHSVSTSSGAGLMSRHQRRCVPEDLKLAIPLDDAALFVVSLNTQHEQGRLVRMQPALDLAQAFWFAHLSQHMPADQPFTGGIRRPSMRHHARPHAQPREVTDMILLPAHPK